MDKPKNSGRFAPGNPGKPKGATTKVTRELKEMILRALDGVGGVEYLQERANDPKTAAAFLTLIGKVLPMTVQGPGPNGEHEAKVIVEFVRPRS